MAVIIRDEFSVLIVNGVYCIDLFACFRIYCCRPGEIRVDVVFLVLVRTILHEFRLCTLKYHLKINTA